MQRWACFFFSFFLLALVTTVRAEEKAAESVVERPELARQQDAEETPSGGAVVRPQGREGRGVVQARTGEHAGRQDVVSMTLNALNPMPYLRGGLSGVREVMNQRFHPFQGMIYRNIPRYNNRFRGGPNQNGGGGRPGRGSGGGQGVKHGGGGFKHGSGGGGFRHGSGGGGFRHGSDGSGFRHGSDGGGFRHGSGGGGGGFRHGNGGGGTTMLRNIKGPNSGHHSDNSFGGHHFSVNSDFPGTSNPPHKPFSSDSGPLNGQHFGTPKPLSLVTNTDTQPHQDTKERDSFTLLPESSPPIHTTPADPPSSPDSEGKFTRIINIQVPEEMQNLTILEISMKANGDVSISEGSEGDITRQLSSVLTDGRDAPTTTSSPLSPGWDDVFAEDQRLHGRESTTDLHDLGLITNQESLRVDNSGLVHFLPVNSYSVSPIHDILRMGAAANTNQVLRNGVPLKWQVINNYQPVTRPQSVGLGGHVTHLLRPVIASSPVPSVSKKLISHKQSLRNNIHFVPVIVSPSSQRKEARESVTPWPHQKQPGQNKDTDSPVYYIDITLPGNGGGTPSVSTSRVRRRRSLEFDGWFPMDVSNPMEDEPTLGYQPPPLQRVRFSNEPVSEKPLYPVVPENPTVFVVRAEPEQPEYHSVYGTENVEYFHINPKSNTVQAFRAPSESVGAIQFVPAPQLSDVSIDTTTMTVEENIDTPSERPEATSNSPIRPAKEDGFADKSDNIAEDDTVSTLTSPDEATHTSKNCESDMEGAFSEIRPSFAQRPYQGPPFRRRYQNRGSVTNRQNLRHRPDPPNRRRDNYYDYVRVDDNTTSRPALHELLGNTPRESQIEESPYLGSATDSAKESFFREIPPPDFRYSTRRSSTPQQPPSAGRGRPREAVARRTPSASSHRPWFLIDTRSPNKRRDPSLASYIFPETLAGDEKVHYKPFGPVSYVTKDKTSLDTIHNPHLDDHMNSYKPTLTANSLSELLQIFRFTQVTGESDATEEPVTVREFRYTRPTESPPNSTEIFPSSFRYTPSPSKFSDPTTEAGVTEKPSKNFLDAVADTNSLDGYLFSDSEASPEYAHPQVQPNVVKVDGKDETTTKSTTRTTLAAKLSTNLNSKNVRGGMVTPGRPEGLEIIYPGQPQTTKDVTPSPFYVIHQGHSKVRVFGINSSEEKKYYDDTFDDLFFLSTAERPSVRSLPLSTTPAQTTSFIPSRGTPSSSTTTTSTSTTTVSLFPSTTTTTTVATTAPSTVEEDTTLPFTEAVTEPSPSNVTAQTTTPDSPPVTVTDEYDYFYDGKLEYPDLAFGEDYPTRGQNLPLLRVPSPFPPEPGFPHLALPISVSGLPPTTLAVPDGFHNRLPQTGSPLHRSEAALNLSPAVALTRAELSVARPVFFTKRRADETEEEPQLSHPFEYLTQLRNIETEKQPVVKDTTSKPVPQPRLKRVTDESGAA